MSKRELTPWFRGSEKPAREGVYKRAMLPDLEDLPFSYWTARGWCQSASSPEAAAMASKLVSRSLHQKLPWRGLTESV